MSAIAIAGRRIGPGEPCYIVAELSGNHHHRFEQAMELVRAARACGADAVKLQTYTPDTITIDCDNAHFTIGAGTLWEGRKLHDLYGEAYTPWEWHPPLKELAESLGMHCFSSPFDASAVDFLEGLRVPAYKIASFELVDLPLIRRVARTGKPIIMSTGMASLDEIDEAVGTARAAGARDLALLACSSAYPAPPEAINLRRIPDLAARFDVITGLSDHTLGIAVPIGAVAVGACVIEKHFCLSRDDPGPDSAFSLEPSEFKALVDAVRTVEKALGRPEYGVDAAEQASQVFRRSLFVVEDVKAGERFTAASVRSIRPGNGLHTRHLEEVIGREASRDILRGTPLSWDLVRKEPPLDGSGTVGR
jgi:pseudaminic acid synthase